MIFVGMCICPGMPLKIVIVLHQLVISLVLHSFKRSLLILFFFKDTLCVVFVVGLKFVVLCLQIFNSGLIFMYIPLCGYKKQHFIKYLLNNCTKSVKRMFQDPVQKCKQLLSNILSRVCVLMLFLLRVM